MSLTIIRDLFKRVLDHKLHLGLLADYADSRDFIADLGGNRLRAWVRTNAWERRPDVLRVKPFAEGPIPARFAGIVPGDKFTIRNQLKVGSCTAFATCYNLVECAIQSLGVEPDYSELALYKFTRDAFRRRGDTGATMREAIWAAANVGVPFEADWPYTDSIWSYNKVPPYSIQAAATKNRIALAWRLDDPANPGAVKPEQLIEAVKRSLLAGYAVEAGFTLYDYGDADGFFAPDGKPIGGRHALKIHSWNDDLLFGPNSWGGKWGKRGWFSVSYDHFRNGSVSDVWVIGKANLSAEIAQ